MLQTKKMIVILGPTSSGKSGLAIKLAQKFGGEIISADSRQVYRGMDIGSGKVTKAEQKLVPHHILDVASPKRQFTVAQFKALAKKAIKDISKRGKIPFLVGGTAFYIYAVVDDLELPSAKPNLKLRKILEKKTVAQLFTMLKKLDPIRAKSIDKNNPHRLVRAIEIVKATGKPVPALSFPRKQESKDMNEVLILGVKKEQDELYRLIDQRVEDRLKQGMVKETKKLLSLGVSHKRLKSIGLTYGIVADYLQKKIGYDDMVAAVKNAEHHLAKRQMTWFKRDQRIIWVKNQNQTEKLITKLL